jgi:hypothetical protein
VRPRTQCGRKARTRRKCYGRGRAASANDARNGDCRGIYGFSFDL